MELKLNFLIYEILIDWIKIEQKLFVLQVCGRFKNFSSTNANANKFNFTLIEVGEKWAGRTPER